ncbi:MAG TPA: hypothetical protein VN750_18585 [Steroidobacteraceae bacterium]|nr:hypothetical protein [Steroidobacteraceae bacterium]
MHRNDPQALIAVLIVLLVLIVAAWAVARQRQSRLLRKRFGPEYDRLLAEHGDRARVESELKAREKRVQGLTIKPLSTADAARFSEEWGTLQSRFIDNPQGVVMQADRLVRDLMIKRGYPMEDFEHRAADISVHHPELVETYRLAQAIAARDQRGEATTEDLRKAVVYYRELFDELLEVRGGKPGLRPAHKEVTQS